MKKAVWSGIIATIGMLALSTSVYAQQTDSGTVNVSATVNAKAKLTINGGSTVSINFPDADPDVDLTIPASNDLTIAVKARTSGTVTLTVRASQNLTSTTSSATIGISALKWTSTGTNFAPTGTSSTGAEVGVMSFSGSGNHTGLQTYALDNSWTYATGTYTTTLTYTLTAP